MKAENRIDLNIDNKGKGRRFESRFLQAGLVKYSFGVCLLSKEVIDRFAYKFVGCPVIIDHKDITDANAKDERVGVISKVWYNEYDGWFWCEGVVFDDEAISLIKDKGYNVSCQYNIDDYTENTANALHNGNPYDLTILDGTPEHLAIVKNPRYEEALIAVNSNSKWKEEEHPRDEQGRFAQSDSSKSLSVESEQKLGEALYLLNKRAKAYRDATSFVKGFGLPSKQIDNVLTETLGVEVKDGKIKIGNEEIRAEKESFGWYTEKDFNTEDDKEKWKDIRKKLDDISTDWTNPLKKQMNELYGYKDKLLKNLDLKPIDKHKFNQGGSYVIKDMYKIGDFEFHGKDDKYYNYTEEEREKIPFLDSITSDVKIDTNMSISDAIKEVKKYIGEDMKAENTEFRTGYDSEGDAYVYPLEGAEKPEKKETKKEDKTDKTKRREVEYKGARIDINPDGKYADVRIYAPDGKTFANGDTWYSTQKLTDKAEEQAKEIIEGEGKRQGWFNKSEDKKEDKKTINKPNSNKKVNIRKNGDSYIAMYVQDLGKENQNQEQVLQTKSFASQDKAEKWANKVLELDTQKEGKQLKLFNALEEQLERFVSLVAKNFDESKHDRDKDGKFTDSGNFSGESVDEQEKDLIKELKQLEKNGQDVSEIYKKLTGKEWSKKEAKKESKKENKPVKKSQKSDSVKFDKIGKVLTSVLKDAEKKYKESK